MKEKETFDIHQGHGNHLECVCETSDLFIRMVPEFVRKANVAWTLAEFPARDRTVRPFTALRHAEQGVGATLLLAGNEEKKSLELWSAYPEYEGESVEVELEAIHEWAAGYEATLEGSMLNGDRQVAFFDTQYARNKAAYRIGDRYQFRLAGMLYHGECLDKPGFSIEGEEANKRRAVFGEAPQFEKDGTPTPLRFDMSRLVAFFTGPASYPDDCEFQSPIYGVRRLVAFGSDFFVFRIAIAHDERDDKQIRIPLLSRSALITGIPPKRNVPLRGHLWLQGHLEENRRSGK